MAGIDYTTQGMIDNIKRLGVLPEANALFDPDALVDTLSGELFSILVPLLVEVKQEYLVSVYDQALSSSARAAFIPARAIGLKLRDVVLLDSGQREIPLRRYEPEDLKEGYQSGALRGIYVDNDRVIFLPTDQDWSPYQVRFRVLRRPNRLIQSSAAAQITAIDTATKKVTCSRVPSAFTVAQTYDLIKGTPSFRAHGEDLVVTTILGFDITFSATLPTDLAVGDWVCPAGFSPIAQIPYDAFPLLEQRGVMKVMEATKDQTGLGLAKDAYVEMVDKFKKLITPRVDGAPQKIVTRRGIGAYNRSRPGWW